MTFRFIDRERLQAELAHLEALIEELPPEFEIDRLSLEARKEEVNKELAEASTAIQHEPARVRLIFNGSPVAGQRGIDAMFATKAVDAYQELVWKTAAIRGAKKKSEKRLSITGVVRGSFGLVLEELIEGFDQDEEDRELLRDAVEEANRLVVAAGQSDDAFVDATEELDERTLGALKKFVQVLHESRATIGIQSAETDSKLGLEELHGALQRSLAPPPTESTENVEGTFLGVLAGSRTFEFSSGGTVYRGKLMGSLDDSTLTIFFRKTCVARIRTKTWKSAGRTFKRHTLLGLFPAKAPPSQVPPLPQPA
jgi:hypothetical protein